MSWTKKDVVEVALKHGVSTAKELYGVSKEQIEQWVKDELKKTVDEVVFSNPTERKVVLYTTEEKTLEKIHELMKDSHNMENKNTENTPGVGGTPFYLDLNQEWFTPEFKRELLGELRGDELGAIQEAIGLLSRVVSLKRVEIYTNKEGVEKISKILREQKEETEITIDPQYFNIVNLGTIEFKEYEE